MFFRRKTAGGHVYLQIVENRWDGKASRQHVLATLGRVDQLEASGQLAGLLASGAKFTETAMVLTASAHGEAPVVRTRHVGPQLVFERLWEESGCGPVVRELLRQRQFDFPVERAVFMTVLHRLVAPGSDRAAIKWRSDHPIRGAEELHLHHLYRAMAWLGDPLSRTEQAGRTPFAPRCTKDQVEEALFARRRDLFSDLAVLLFDTTSIYFEGEGGDTLGAHGKSKDHRPDLPQMVVGLVLDQNGRPVCCEMWPGNTTDVRSLVPVVRRLRQRFGIKRVCVVADRGMISRATIRALESGKLDWLYILGARMRSFKEVRDEVLSRPGRYHEVTPPREKSTDPSPLSVKEVWVEKRRYLVCFNEEQARKDAADREAILAGLEEKLRKGAKSFVGNKGYRRYLAGVKEGTFRVDLDKVRSEARYDGKWVLRTNTDWTPTEVALCYKQLWRVEALFRATKTILETRPVWHKCDETIRGHVFCSFLALALLTELRERLKDRGDGKLEWADVIHDLDELTEAEVDYQGKCFILRSDARGTCGKAFQAAGVALPPTLRRAEVTPVT